MQQLKQGLRDTMEETGSDGLKEIRKKNYNRKLIPRNYCSTLNK